MPSVVTRYPRKTNKLEILFRLTYPEILVKINAGDWAVEHPQSLRLKKPVVTTYPPKPNHL